MRLIVGLGNPGVRYRHTRHNVGREVVEFVAAQFLSRFSRKKSLDAFLTEVVWEGQDIVLAYPETYMNISGYPVAALVNHFSLDVSKDVLVVVDDVALPLGRVRIRPRGSDGGHKGLRCIHETLGTSEYARLRVGIGPSGPDSREAESMSEGELVRLEKYVLSKFGRSEKKVLEAVFEKGFDACRLWVGQPIEAVMNAVNSR